MISYAGVPLVQPSAELAGWVATYISVQDCFSFYRPSSLSTPDLNPRPHFNWFLGKPIKVNTLSQPWGASRWGMCFVLADEGMLDDIRSLVSGSDYSAQPLVIDDGLGRSVETDMWMLPAVPLSEIIPNSGPTFATHLIPLVDDRYFWWERAAIVSVDEGTTTWAEVYASIASGLGITLTAEAVSADYLLPSGGLGRAYQYLPLLLDHAAQSVGQRIVRTLDGTYLARSATTAKALMTAQADAWSKVAGGSLDLIADSDPNVPASVGVAFPRNDQGPADTAHYFVSKSLATLSLDDYDGLTGHPGTHIVHSSAIAQFSSGINPDNETELKALATQVATDFYLWRLAAMEVRYTGKPVPWVADGMHDIEWSHDGRGVITTVSRSTWDIGLGELKHSGTYESSDAVVCDCYTNCNGVMRYLRFPKTWLSDTPCEAPSGIGDDCTPCNEESCYQVRFTDIAAGTCTDCVALFDADIILIRTSPSSYQWDSESISCSSMDPGIHLAVALTRLTGCAFNLNVYLVFGPPSNTFYVIKNYTGTITTDCSGGTFTTIGTTDPYGICTNWPATVDVLICTGSGSGSTGISITGIGTSSSGGSPTSILTIPSVSAPSGLLVVLASAIGTGGPSSSVMAAAFNGTSPDGTISKTFYAASQLYAYYWHLTGATTGDITLSVPAGKTAVIQAALLTIDGLVDNALDASGTASGTGAAPSAAATTVTADTAILAAFGVVNAGGSTFTYNGGFTSGLQDVQDLLSAGVYDNLTEGRQIASATGTYTAGFASIDALTAWGGLVVAFK